MNLTIRRAELADAPAIAELHQITWRETYPGLLPAPVLDGLALPRLYRQWRADLIGQEADLDHGVFLALDEHGEAAGFASCGQARGQAREVFGQGEITMVYVRAADQGRGLGRGLMLACARWLLIRGMFSAGVWVVRGNGRARRFYEGLGGRKVGEKRDPMGGWMIPVVGYGWQDLADLAGMDATVMKWED
ncbi:MAG: GNAT family N-acetyltransferase [Hyphomonadaceae bacterium]|jgi:GNAT superfamily N-acetyltransferase|nr:GNAT family N-acetyltransferase [Hyphomonadaceae bacterium]